MKKILLGLALLTLTSTAMAQHWHHHWNHHHRHHGYIHGGGNGNWVAPLIIGGVVGAAIANNRRQETIVLQQPPVYVHRQTVCTEWKEIMNADGIIYRERTCTQ
ncbi:MAG: hypothetical protein ACOVK2_01330 [Candidatus Fonsibacter sp.]|jgi:hypothetical protein